MFHAYWPALTALTMFVLGVLVAMLKYGPRLCKTRHHTLPTHHDWEDEGYVQEISNA